MTAFDPPPGDGQEHDDEIAYVTDGRPDTYWETENYRELDLAPKPGVGLLFDLGRARPVGSFRLMSPFPGFQFQVRVGNDPDTLASTSGPSFTSRSDMTEEIPQVSGRYVLVWITSVIPDVDGGNRATIGEFRAFGPSG